MCPMDAATSPGCDLVVRRPCRGEGSDPSSLLLPRRLCSLTASDAAAASACTSQAQQAQARRNCTIRPGSRSLRPEFNLIFFVQEVWQSPGCSMVIPASAAVCCAHSPDQKCNLSEGSPVPALAVAWVAKMRPLSIPTASACHENQLGSQRNEGWPFLHCQRHRTKWRHRPGGTPRQRFCCRCTAGTFRQELEHLQAQHPCSRHSIGCSGLQEPHLAGQSVATSCGYEC